MRQPGAGAITLPPLAPAETQLADDDMGEYLVRRMLAGRYHWQLPTFYAGLAARGYRLPTSTLAAVLADQAANLSGRVNPAVVQTLGKRGRWLAQQHPAWQHLLARPNETTWATDSALQRQQFIRAYRSAAPDQARAFLATHLPQIPADEQAQLLREVAQHLSSADEPLLTPYLHSADATTRQTASKLLAQIPGSWLAEQVWAATQAFLTLHTTSAGQLELLVIEPPRWQAAWQAVGIERYRYGTAEEPMWWVGQLLAFVPPQRWVAQWHLTPAQLLRLAASAAGGPDLFIAWATAARLHEQVAWASALAEAELIGFPLPAQPRTGLYSPVNVLDLAEAVALLLPHIPPEARFNDTPAPWQQMLHSLPKPWPTAFLQRVLHMLAISLEKTAYRDFHQGFRTIRHLLLHDLVAATAPTDYALVELKLVEMCQLPIGHHDLLEGCLHSLRFQYQLTQWLTNLPIAQAP